MYFMEESPEAGSQSQYPSFAIICSFWCSCSDVTCYISCNFFSMLHIVSDCWWVWFGLLWFDCITYCMQLCDCFQWTLTMTSVCISASFCLAFWILWDTQSAKLFLVSHKFQPVPGCIIFAWQIISFLDFYQRLSLQIYAFIKVLISFSKLHYWLLRLWWVAKSIVLSVLYLTLKKKKKNQTLLFHAVQYSQIIIWFHN